MESGHRSLIEMSSTSRWIPIVVWMLASIPISGATAGVTLRGRITAERAAASIQIVLQEPGIKNLEAARVDTDKDGNYMIRGLQKRSYVLITLIDGKKQDRQNIEIVCRNDSTVSKDFHFGRIPSTLILRFPAEDPDFADVAELGSSYPRDIVREFEKARQDHLNGKFSRAIEKLESIATRVPDFYPAHARLGLIYQQQGCFEDSASEYARASAISPRSSQPLLNMASVQLQAANAPGVRDTMVARALETLAKALAIKPRSALAYCLSGEAHAMVNAYPDAERDFKHALELDEQLGAARLMLADVYIRQENWKAAIEPLTQYLMDSPFAQDRAVVKEMLENALSKAQKR